MSSDLVIEYVDKDGYNEEVSFEIGSYDNDMEELKGLKRIKSWYIETNTLNFSDYDVFNDCGYGERFTKIFRIRDIDDFLEALDGWNGLNNRYLRKEIGVVSGEHYLYELTEVMRELSR